MRQVGFVAAALAFTGSAYAADLPVKAPPMLAPAFSWTGFYIGGTLGGIFPDNTVDVTTVNTANNIGGNLSALGLTAGPASAAAATGSFSGKGSNVIGGFEAGYNWQLAPSFLLGLEADISAIANGGSSGFTQTVARDALGHTFTATVSATDNLDWLGTVRGRLGFLATPTWLIYGTGGLAYGGVSSNTSITGRETGIVPPDPFTPINGAGGFSDTRFGWAAGAGIEFLLIPNWTVKAEWLHYDLGSVTYSNGTMNASIAGVLEFTDVSSTTVRFRGDIARAGINYKF